MEEKLAMNTKKSRQEQEKEMAAYFQAHKDEDEWEAAKATRPARAGMVYSIRFTSQELDALRAIADQEGRRISDLVHEALATYLTAKTKGEPKYSVVADVYRSGFVLYHGPTSATTAAAKPKQLTYGRVEADIAATAVI